MKKKILLVLLLIVGIFTITGCGSNETENNNRNNTNSNSQKTNDKLEAKVNDLVIELNYTGTLSNMFYKYPSKAVDSSVGTYSIMDYMNNGEFVFRILVAKFDNTAIDTAMNSSITKKTGTKNINNIEWNIYEGIQEDGKKTIAYACSNDSDVYSVTFVFDDNVDDLINLFMNNVKFN